jgi:sigma-E factor negative regulatory protein RseB
MISKYRSAWHAVIARMRVRSAWLRVALGLLSLVISGWQVVIAQPATAMQSDSALLMQIQQAARTLNYTGIFAYQQGEVIESSRISHHFDGTDEKERIELLNGSPREYLRLNSSVQCLIPEDKKIVLERERGARFPGLLLSNTESIDAHYSVRVLPEPLRVAGRQCQVVDIVPRDAYRYGYRLCVDTESQLLLKAQTISVAGEVIEQVAFTHVTIGQDVTEKMLRPAWSTQGWTVVESRQQSVDLSALGWRISAPSGFTTRSQSQQVFDRDKLVHQLVLSDGLATISIFIEPYLNERSEYKPVGAAQIGSVNIYGIKVANFWLTVLGEVPASALQQLAQSIQYVPAAKSK